MSETVGAGVDEIDELAAAAIRGLRHARWSVATAESLTGGLVCAALTSVPGASAVVRGGVVAYATDVKESLSGVDGEVLRAHGPVAVETATAMARGVRLRLAADVGVASTGVAGPDPQDGHPPGTVHVAVVSPESVVARSFDGAERMTGDRAGIRRATVAAALRALVDSAS